MGTRRVDVDEVALETAYNNGAGLAQLQKEFGINRMTARKILLSRGVTVRSPGRPRKTGSSVVTSTRTSVASEAPVTEPTVANIPRSFSIIGSS